MPLEALRHDHASGLHYLLIHYDIPDVDEAAFRLEVDGLVARHCRSRSRSCAPARQSSWR